MKQYPHIKVDFNGNAYTLFVNGEKYAKVGSVETLSDCINFAIQDYYEEDNK